MRVIQQAGESAYRFLPNSGDGILSKRPGFSYGCHRIEEAETWRTLCHFFATFFVPI
jgi:hypothetical protein